MTALRPSNPFATRFVRPNVVPYLDRDNLLETTVSAFRKNAFKGQIVGPHGTGKTCLAIAVTKRLESSFQNVRRITIRSQQSVTAFDAGISQSTASSHAPSLLVVDGFERLSLIQRWLLIKNIQRDSGLLITSHAILTGIPVVAEIEPDLNTYLRLVDHLAPCHSFAPEFLTAVFDECNQNVRESLMRLFDELQR